jgi:predicted phosphodiesterase
MKFSQPIQLKVSSYRQEKSKRIVCLSDTDKMKIKTLFENKVIPDGDIFIHCGDLSNCGTIEELEGEKNSKKLIKRV